MTGEQLNRLVTMAYQTGATIAVIHELDDNITKLEGYVTDSMRRALRCRGLDPDGGCDS